VSGQFNSSQLHNILEQGEVVHVLYKVTSANTKRYLPTIPRNDLNSI
jgi:hypothetical protein